MSISSVNPSPVSTASTTTATTAASDSGSSFFGDLWDTVNPLQHIPIVSSVYRLATGDTISPLSDIAGATIYGGPLGGAIAAISEAGQAFLGIGPTAKTATATAAPSPAVASAQIEPAAGAPASGNLQKFHASTHDWLNQALGTQTASSNANSASASYKRIQAATSEWLNSSPALPASLTA